MNPEYGLTRLRFVTLFGAGALTGCSGIATSLNSNASVQRLLESPEKLDLATLGAGQPLAREYTPADVSADFRQNGFDPPAGAEYVRWSSSAWHGYRLFITGLVDRPASYSLQTMRSKFVRRSQITRHDCVEGWSVIGKWSGVRLSEVLMRSKPKPQARYVIFHCMDDDGSGTRYYESLDMRQAAHPQALLAYELNDRPIPVKNGAPLRLRVPTQLGYKSAKYVQHLEIVAALGGANGKGGYWEDQGYEWFAGI